MNNSSVKIFRLAIFSGIFIFILVLFYQLLNFEEFPKLSDIVLIITALFMAWSSLETHAIVELTRKKEQPFLEIVFPDNKSNLPFQNTIVLKNFGQSPAYSPKIESIEIETDRFDFDPLESSRLPIQPNEIREVWIHLMSKTNKGTTSVGNVLPLLVKRVVEYHKKHPTSKQEFVISCFDNLGKKCERNLYINIGGIGEKKYIYTSTSKEPQ